MLLPWQHTFCQNQNMCFAHLHQIHIYVLNSRTKFMTQDFQKCFALICHYTGNTLSANWCQKVNISQNIDFGYTCKWKRYHVTCTSAACISSYIIKPVRPSLYNTLPGYRGVRHWIIATETGIWVYPFHWFIVMLLHVTGNHSLGYFVKTVTCISKTFKCHQKFEWVALFHSDIVLCIAALTYM